jgi:RHS repeat-associated protein
MTYNSNVGNYYYKDPGVNAGPHALTGTVTQTGYNYDKNGSMTAGNGKTIEWTSFNKPNKFIKGTNSVEFSYGPEYDRYKKKEIKDTGTVETIYIDKVYEKITEGNRTTHKYFMYAEGHLATIHVKTFDNTTQLPDETRYLHYDPLGSVDTITDNRGNIIERISYEAFGKRREGNWQSAANALPTFTNRGFTGHEHIDSMGIIHMNGRVYDPELGRFLSADPFVSDPENTQSFNRYSYCFNNPFKYTDPSGFWEDEEDWGVDDDDWGDDNGDWEDNGNDNSLMSFHQNLYNFDPYSGYSCITGEKTPTYVEVHAGIERVTNFFGIMIDYTPLVGDAKGTVDAGIGIYERPTDWGSYAFAGIVVVGYFGFDFLKSIKYVPKNSTKLLGGPIHWKPKDIKRVISKHGSNISGKGGVLKSRFFEGENIGELITSGIHQQANKQVSGKNLQRTFNVGRNIGTDVMTGRPTSIMTVITQPSGRLVTAFPGRP